MAIYSLSFKIALPGISRKIPQVLLSHIFEHIENMSGDPIPHDVQKPAGAESLYRIRVGDYRIVYQALHESHDIVVFYIRHRSVAYRGL